MDWIKELLKANTDENGVLNVEAFEKAYNTEFPKHAVPKENFNKKVEELKIAAESLETANKAIDELKKDNKDNAELQTTIENLKKDLKHKEEQAAKQQREFTLKAELSKNGVLDPDYRIYKQGGLDGFTFDKDGGLIGLSDVITKFKEDKAYKHLFKAENPNGFNPQGGNPPDPDKNPFAKDSFNLTKQGELLKSNPTKARELAEAAGIAL